MRPELVEEFIAILNFAYEGEGLRFTPQQKLGDVLADRRSDMETFLASAAGAYCVEVGDLDQQRIQPEQQSLKDFFLALDPGISG